MKERPMGPVRDGVDEAVGTGDPVSPSKDNHHHGLACQEPSENPGLALTLTVNTD